MSVHQLKAQDPIKDMTPAEFFNELVPKILEVQKEACAALGGTYGVQLFGDNGGAWTLDFKGAKLTAGVGGDVDFYLEMRADDFQKLMKGTLDVEKAALEGRIAIDGDPAMFNNLAAVLQPAE